MRPKGAIRQSNPPPFPKSDPSSDLHGKNSNRGGSELGKPCKPALQTFRRSGRVKTEPSDIGLGPSLEIGPRPVFLCLSHLTGSPGTNLNQAVKNCPPQKSEPPKFQERKNPTPAKGKPHVAFTKRALFRVQATIPRRKTPLTSTCPEAQEGREGGWRARWVQSCSSALVFVGPSGE